MFENVEAFAMGFIRLMVAMIFIMLFGYWDHKNVALFLEYLRTLKGKAFMEVT